MFNLDDAVAKQPSFEFTFDGVSFACSSPSAIDIRTLSRTLSEIDNDPAAALHLLLGDEQYARLEELEATFSLQHLKALMEAWSEFYEVDLPKSGGSPTATKTIQMR